MSLALLIAVPLAAYYLLLVWRTRVERGWVGLTDAGRLLLAYRGHFVRMARLFAEELTPAVRRACEAIEAWRLAFDETPIL